MLLERAWTFDHRRWGALDQLCKNRTNPRDRAFSTTWVFLGCSDGRFAGAPRGLSSAEVAAERRRRRARRGRPRRRSGTGSNRRGVPVFELRAKTELTREMTVFQLISPLMARKIVSFGARKWVHARRIRSSSPSTRSAPGASAADTGLSASCEQLNAPEAARSHYFSDA
jgi:hypothetical protein